ncbi:RNA polymerase sigma-70 factor [Alistipes sp.]|uniref:RNA polymerase sigma-70 factor n=1 Tax=Alistipes sp. TaxID=1872444 RepID=UPI0025C05192|nr:RNA polymerase sigma-70 factor [Alistipes sp.]
MEILDDNRLTSAELSTIYSEYYQKLVIIALRYVRAKSAAEDIVTDSFVSFWEHRDKFTRADNKIGYLLTIVKHNCMNYLHRQQSFYKIEQQLGCENQRMLNESIRALGNFEPTTFYATEVQQIIRRELDKLPELTRKIFEQNRFMDKTYDEIAEELGITRRKVTSEIQNVLAIMRKALAEYLPVAGLISVILNNLHKY